jgi:hypothetical protein
MAILAAATFLGAALLGMPEIFLLVTGGLAVLFTVMAIAKRKR